MYKYIRSVYKIQRRKKNTNTLICTLNFFFFLPFIHMWWTMYLLIVYVWVIWRFVSYSISIAHLLHIISIIYSLDVVILLLFLAFVSFLPYIHCVRVWCVCVCSFYLFIHFFVQLSIFFIILINCHQHSFTDNHTHIYTHNFPFLFSRRRHYELNDIFMSLILFYWFVILDSMHFFSFKMKKKSPFVLVVSNSIHNVSGVQA